MTKPVSQPNRPDDGASPAADRLQRLAAFIPRLYSPRQEAAQPIVGEGTDAAPYRPGVSPTASLEAEFSQMVYDAGWVMPGFDWSEWARSDEGRRLQSELAALAGATEEDLVKLLTALVRQERFAEGTIADALNTGLLLAIAERADVLRAERTTQSK